jgi:DinB superfamily
VTCCQECGFDWASPIPHSVHTVDAFPARVVQLLHETGTADGDARLRTRPADEVWSPLEYIAHTGDAIGWYTGRITRVLAERRPQLHSYDWDLHTTEQDYRQRLLDDVLADLGRICVRFTFATADLSEAAWQREGIGSDGTPRTCAHLARRAAHEAHHHLGDIRAGLTV